MLWQKATFYPHTGCSKNSDFFSKVFLLPLESCHYIVKIFASNLHNISPLMCVNALFFQSFDAKIFGRLNLKFFLGHPLRCPVVSASSAVLWYNSFFMTTFQDAWEAQCLKWCCMGTRVFFSVVYWHHLERFV